MNDMHVFSGAMFDVVNGHFSGKCMLDRGISADMVSYTVILMGIEVRLF